MSNTLDMLLLIGRIALGGVFLMSALNHFLQGKNMIGYARMKGIPAPALAVYGTGALLLVGSLSVLLGFEPRVGLALLALFLIGVTPTMHGFWKETDAMAKMSEQTAFMKNTALLGAALALLSVAEPWSFALGA